MIPRSPGGPRRETTSPLLLDPTRCTAVKSVKPAMLDDRDSREASFPARNRHLVEWLTGIVFGANFPIVARFPRSA
ncbi:MAG: hypothetical protein ACREFP_16920 [Acetobacteraceae bacterium]